MSFSTTKHILVGGPNCGSIEAIPDPCHGIVLPHPEDGDQLRHWYAKTSETSRLGLPVALYKGWGEVDEDGYFTDPKK